MYYLTYPTAYYAHIILVWMFISIQHFNQIYLHPFMQTMFASFAGKVENAFVIAAMNEKGEVKQSRRFLYSFNIVMSKMAKKGNSFSEL